MRHGLRRRIRIEIVAGDHVVVDETTGMLLLLIEKCGSILCAARRLGLAYSRAWERIARAERLLGERIVEARRGGRGGGGASLTEAGRELLALFLEAYRGIHGAGPGLDEAASGARSDSGSDVLVYAGSSDLALQRLIGWLRDDGVLVEAHWLGSLRGVAALVLGEADITGLHVLDPDTGAYNLHVVKGLVGGIKALLVKGYMRLQGFVTRKPMGLEEIIEGLLSGRLRLVNRPEGSGTRLLLESLLRTEAAKRGLSWDPGRLIKGWDSSARTHVEVAEQVARGDADTGLVIEAVARLYNLYFVPVQWEHFDFLVSGKRLGDEKVQAFLDALCSTRFRSLLGTLHGYRVPSDYCSQAVYPLSGSG